MKIAIAVSHFPQISETFILNRITGLIDRGHEVDIYAYEDGASQVVHSDVSRYHLLERTHYFNVPANRIRRVLHAMPLFAENVGRNPSLILNSLNPFRFGKEALSLRLFYGTLPFLNHHDYDIVHSHHGPNGLKDTWLKELGAFGGKHVISFHGADATRHVLEYGPHVYDRLFERGDLFLPVSQGIKKRLISLGCREDKIRVHPSGIDCKKFSYDDKRPSDTRIRVVTVGRLVEKKGLQDALRAVAILKDRLPHMEYVIVGEGPMKTSLADLARQLGVLDRVQFVGGRTQDEVADILRDSQIMLAPSVTAGDGNAEGIPNSIKEAMASGVPVIATPNGDISELVEDERTGYLVEEHDSEALALRLNQVIERRENTEKVCHAARTVVEERFDVERLNDRLVDLYQGLLH